MSQVSDYSFVLFLYSAPRVCLLLAIKHYKNILRVRIMCSKEIQRIRVHSFKNKNVK